jgi:hypothetical protein
MQLRKQGETIQAYSLILSHDHDVIEKRVDGRTRLRQRR